MSIINTKKLQKRTHIYPKNIKMNQDNDFKKDKSKVTM